MILYGAGGHAKVIYDRLQEAGMEVRCLFDDNPDIKSFMNHKIVYVYDKNLFRDTSLLITIGSNAVRRDLSEMIVHTIGIFIDPTSVVSKSSQVGAGSMVLTNALIHAEGIIGNHCIINSGAIIEHDVSVGNFVHIGPGAVICGEATIGEGVLIGANATILPGIKIGDWAVVGAGSVVTRNIGNREVVVGNPARRISMS